MYFLTYLLLQRLNLTKSSLTRGLQVGGGVIYLTPRPGFLTTAPKLLGIFWNASVTFPTYRPTGWAKLSDTTLHFCL